MNCSYDDQQAPSCVCVYLSVCSLQLLSMGNGRNLLQTEVHLGRQTLSRWTSKSSGKICAGSKIMVPFHDDASAEFWTIIKTGRMEGGCIFLNHNLGFFTGITE